MSPAVAGAHNSALAVGFVTAACLIPAADRRWGRGAVLRLGSLLLASGVVGFCICRTAAVSLLAAGVIGAGGAATIVGINAFLSDRVAPKFAPRALSELAGVAALVGLVSPVLLALSVATGIGWRALLAGIATAAIALEVVRRGRLRRFDDHGPQVGTQNWLRGGGGLPRRFWVAWAFLIPAVGLECTTLFWGVSMLRSRLDVSAPLAAAALSVNVAGLVAGRLLLGPLLLKRIDREKVLLGCHVVGGIGLALFLVLPSRAGALFGFMLLGLGVSMFWPLGIARLIRGAGGQSTAASGLAAVATGAANGLAPLALGYAAEGWGVSRAATVVLPLLLVLATALTVMSMRAFATDP